MKRLLILVIGLLGFVLPATAGVGGYQSTTYLGLFEYLKCSTGMTCTKVGDKFNMVANPSSLTSATLTLADSETINNASDVLTFGFDDAAATIRIKAFEATDSSLVLQADESDDSGDDWQISSVASGNALTFSNDTSGSQVSKMSLSTAGELSGFKSPLVLATATTITSAQCGSTFYNGGAVQMELPEASTVLGCTVTFATLSATNFDINPDTGDTIVLLGSAAGDAIRNATIGNSVTLRAVSASQWVQVGIIGTYTDIN